jgi:hypothetical protein
MQPDANQLAHAFAEGEKIVMNPESLAMLVDQQFAGDTSHTSLLTAVIAAVPLHYGYWKHVKRLFKHVEAHRDSIELMALLIWRFEYQTPAESGNRLEFEEPQLLEHASTDIPSDKTINYMRRRARRFMHKVLQQDPDRYIDLVTAILGLDIQIKPAWDQWLLCEIAFGDSRSLYQASHSRGRMHFPRRWWRDVKPRQRLQNRWRDRLDVIAPWLHVGSLPRAEFVARICLEIKELPARIADERLTEFLESANAPLITLASRILEKEPYRISEQSSGTLAKALVTLDARERNRLWRVLGNGESGPSAEVELALHFDSALYYLSYRKVSASTTNGQRLLGLTKTQIAERALWALRIDAKALRDGKRTRIRKTYLPDSFFLYRTYWRRGYRDESRQSCWGLPVWRQQVSWSDAFDIEYCADSLSEQLINISRQYKYIDEYVVDASSDRLISLIAHQFRIAGWREKNPPVAPDWFNRLAAKEILSRIKANILSKGECSLAVAAIVCLAGHGIRSCTKDELRNLMVHLESHHLVDELWKPRPYWLDLMLGEVLVERLRDGQIAGPLRSDATHILVVLAAAGVEPAPRDEIVSFLSILNEQILKTILKDVELPVWLARPVYVCLLKLIDAASPETRQELAAVIVEFSRRGRLVYRRSEIGNLLSMLSEDYLQSSLAWEVLPDWLARQIIAELADRITAGNLSDSARAETLAAVPSLLSRGVLSYRSSSFRSYVHSLAAADLVSLVLDVSDEIWEEHFDNPQMLSAKMLGRSDIVAAAWKHLGDEDSAGTIAESRLVQRIFQNRSVSSRSFQSIEIDSNIGLSDAQATLVAQWLTEGVHRPEFDTDEILNLCTSTNLALSEAALGFARQIGLNTSLALRLFESGFPAAVDTAREYFDARLDDENNREAILVLLCDSPQREVRKFGLRLIATHWEALDQSTLIRSLSESRDAEIRSFVALALKDNAWLDSEDVDTFDSELLAARNRQRDARELVKSRRSTKPSEPAGARTPAPAERYVQEVLDLALGPIVADRDWAFAELIKLKHAGFSIPSLELHGVSEEI